MGQYTETIKNREYRDKYLADKSESYLTDKDCPSVKSSSLRFDEVMFALEYILEKFNLKARHINNCQSLRELLDCTLDPEGILYEEIDTTAGIKNSTADSILAFADGGRPIVIMPAIFGHSYYIPSLNKYGRFNKNIKLKAKAYVINRPVPADKFSLTSFISFTIKSMSARDIALIAITSFAISLLGTFIPEINRLLLGQYVNMTLDSVLGLLTAACLGLGIVYALRALVTCIRQILLSYIKLKNNLKAEAAFMARLLLVPMSFFRDKSSGRISSIADFGRKLSDVVTESIVGTSVTSLFSLMYIAEATRISPALMGVALIILIIKFLAIIVSNYSEADNRSKVVDNELALSDYNFTVFKGIQKFKTSGAENRVYSKWAQMFRTNLHLNFNPPSVVKYRNTIYSAISFVGTIGLLLAASRYDVTAADYIAFLSIYTMIDIAVEQIAEIGRSVRVSQLYINRLKPLMDASVDNANIDRNYVHDIMGGISFDNVCLSYPGNNGFRIDNLSLRIHPKEKVALVGPSGSGKSSLINILTGINTPDSGEVYIDGKEISHMNQRSLCRQIGSVSQFSKLFPGTIKFNVSIGNSDISDEDVWKALDAAAIGDTVRTFPLGINTEISESQSGGFSGGQKQRLLLARSFASHHRIIILDEATSALDNITQQKVLESIYSLDATVIMIAHRLSTVKQCDRIFVVDNGSIVEEGTYEDLISRKGKFYKLIRQQLIE